MKKNESEIPKYCEYCRYACAVAMTQDMLCEKKGIVPKDYSCRGFMYDPLKRVPRKLPSIAVPEDLTEDI